MYIGLYKSKIRLKNRVAFPSKFRNITGDDLYITNWFEKSLIVLPKKEWEKVFSDELRTKPFLLTEARDLDRFIFGGTFSIELDNEGRFVLPVSLKEYANMKKNIIFTGGMWYVQMWDEQIFEAYRTMNTLQIKEKAEKLFERLKNKTTNE